LASQVREAIRVKALDKKWQLDPPQFVKKISHLDEHEATALIDAIEQGIVHAAAVETAEGRSAIKNAARQTFRILGTELQR
jgi:hypothetical protein